MSNHQNKNVMTISVIIRFIMLIVIIKAKISHEFQGQTQCTHMYTVHTYIYVDVFECVCIGGICYFCRSSSARSLWLVFSGINCAGSAWGTHTHVSVAFIYAKKPKSWKKTRTRHSGIESVARGSCANGIWPIYVSAYIYGHTGTAAPTPAW